MAVPTPTKLGTSNTEYFKERRAKMAIASRIIDSLPQITRQQDVAKQLGLTKMGIYTIERMAIYKIYAALKSTVIKDQIHGQ